MVRHLAGLIVVVGFSRAVFAAKGWAYYSVNMFFCAKMAAFAAVALLSIAPTIRIIRGRTLAGDVPHLGGVFWSEVAQGDLL